MRFSSVRPKEWMWFVGAIVASGLLAWVPYGAWNLFGGVATWWRVPAVTPGLFDAYVYLHWMGAAAMELPYGGHLKWFGPVLAVLWKGMGPFASVPELWIVSRWITTALALFAGAWTIRAWSGLGTWGARFFSVGFWLAVLGTLSFRPGVYGWYMPFCMAAIGCIWFTHRALTRQRVVVAIGWSVLSLALAWIYPWFFLFCGVWLAAVWGNWLLGQSRMLFWIAWIAIAAVIGALAIPIAHWFLAPAQQGLVGMYERNGVTFAYFPLIANTILAIGTWVVLLAATVRLRGGEGTERLTLLATGWIALIPLWFHTPFTGLHLYSDHFISPVAVMAWITLAAVWKVIRRPSQDEAIPAGRWERALILAVAIGATLFVLYVLQQPIRGNFLKFDSYVIHLAHWFALALAAWMIWMRTGRPTQPFRPFVVGAVILIPALALTVCGTIPLFLRDLPLVSRVMEKTPVIDWIRMETTEDARFCSDPETASFFAAHTGRRIDPAEAVLSWPDSSDLVIRNLQVIASGYDVIGAGKQAEFQFATDHYRTLSCASGGYARNAPYARVLSVLGLDEATVNRIIGCRTDVIEHNRALVDAAIRMRALLIEPFRALCPRVIVTQEQKPYWHFPKDYVEHRITSDISVWQTP